MCVFFGTLSRPSTGVCQTEGWGMTRGTNQSRPRERGEPAWQVSQARPTGRAERAGSGLGRAEQAGVNRGMDTPELVEATSVSEERERVGCMRWSR
jgi:hypothetical protein